MVNEAKKLWAEGWVRAVITLILTATISWATALVTMREEQVRQEEQINSIREYIHESRGYLQEIDQRLSRIEGRLQGHQDHRKE
jgi:hypothetical protein